MRRALNDSAFDEGALDAYLREHLDGYAGRMNVTPLSGGQSNPTFLLERAGRRLVLRKKPPGNLLPSAHAVDREYRVITALYGTDVPVARSLLFCADSRVIGTPFYVMEHVTGRQFMDPALPELSADDRRHAWDAFNRVVAALHSVDFAARGLADYGKRGNYFQRQIGVWTRQYRASETERIEAMDRLIEWLPQHVPATDETTIVHGDLRIDNLIFDATAPRILAVLDWELSTLGHPLADLAYHVMSWRLTSVQFRGMAEHDLAALGIPVESEYVRRYCERTGRQRIDPAEWEFAMAFSMFRLAAILQGIAKRAIDGSAASDSAFEVGRRARTVADVGWRQVEALLQRDA
ncbi:MAG TPA: phosphotransferase [Casimicrobiaceae bacterium]|nr:phosphotransferase [Casimicrobiaceae bacterium]